MTGSEWLPPSAINHSLTFPAVGEHSGYDAPAACIAAAGQLSAVNKLYFGDNLPVLRDRIQPESVDLIYLDPPFNSNTTYSLLFKEPSGEAAQAQAEAFRDTWEWGGRRQRIL
jgi:site-specific DNA-methyltransferase (adenine-specific)